MLLGWSTGATMALRAAARSGVADRVSGLILDSPVLSWEATLRALAAARRTPGALLPLAVRAAQGRTGLHTDPGEGPAEPDGLTVPALVFHGPDDTVAPWAHSRRFADRHPGLVTLRTVPQAPHGAMWNADPAAYEEALRRFMVPPDVTCGTPSDRGRTRTLPKPVTLIPLASRRRPCPGRSSRVVPLAESCLSVSHRTSPLAIPVARGDIPFGFSDRQPEDCTRDVPYPARLQASTRPTATPGRRPPEL
ncbi:hypothetical protein GCM10020256_60690 [Streptomyces thermocoprophilus]